MIQNRNRKLLKIPNLKEHQSDKKTKYEERINKHVKIIYYFYQIYKIKLILVLLD